MMLRHFIEISHYFGAAFLGGDWRQVLDKNPPLSMLDLKNNAITEEGAKMLAEARASGKGKKI